uniref:Uncharacterized protein n=1 Tax=Molossus molossus TaxID=27622 RepID=A0A7J8I920_MOLMO|nr:hypothetical protein HJG59_010601 [Molossus molossus]
MQRKKLSCLGRGRAGRAGTAARQRRERSSLSCPILQTASSATCTSPSPLGGDMDLSMWPLGTQPHVSALSIFLDRVIQMKKKKDVLKLFFRLGRKKITLVIFLQNGTLISPGFCKHPCKLHVLSEQQCDIC